MEAPRTASDDLASSTPALAFSSPPAAGPRAHYGGNIVRSNDAREVCDGGGGSEGEVEARIRELLRSAPGDDDGAPIASWQAKMLQATVDRLSLDCPKLKRRLMATIRERFAVDDVKRLPRARYDELRALLDDYARVLV